MIIELNKQLDKEVYLDFCDANVGGVDFGKKIKGDHPLINKENYSEYIDDFYISNADKLESTLRDTESCFNEIQTLLFFELKKYFDKDFSKANYKCYLSIFNCNPRYLENKGFQVFYKRSRNMKKEVIAHELTHFAFYDFCQKLGIKNDNNLWELSEIFNVIFLNIPSIQKAIGTEELLFYPNLKGKLGKIKQIWDKQPDLDSFIKAALQSIQALNVRT